MIIKVDQIRLPGLEEMTVLIRDGHVIPPWLNYVEELINNSIHCMETSVEHPEKFKEMKSESDNYLYIASLIVCQQLN
jgi:hypothetical protein